MRATGLANIYFARARAAPPLRDTVRPGADSPEAKLFWKINVCGRNHEKRSTDDSDTARSLPASPHRSARSPPNAWSRVARRSSGHKVIGEFCNGWPWRTVAGDEARGPRSRVACRSRARGPRPRPPGRRGEEEKRRREQPGPPREGKSTTRNWVGVSQICRHSPVRTGFLSARCCGTLAPAAPYGGAFGATVRPFSFAPGRVGVAERALVEELEPRNPRKRRAGLGSRGGDRRRYRNAAEVSPGPMQWRFLMRIPRQERACQERPQARLRLSAGHAGTVCSCDRASRESASSEQQSSRATEQQSTRGFWRGDALPAWYQVDYTRVADYTRGPPPGLLDLSEYTKSQKTQISRPGLFCVGFLHLDFWAPRLCRRTWGEVASQGRRAAGLPAATGLPKRRVSLPQLGGKFHAPLPFRKLHVARGQRRRGKHLCLRPQSILLAPGACRHGMESRDPESNPLTVNRSAPAGHGIL